MDSGSSRWVLLLAIPAAAAGLAVVVATHMPPSDAHSDTRDRASSAHIDQLPSFLPRAAAETETGPTPQARTLGFAPAAAVVRGPFVWPVAGVVTQEMHPGRHWGIDIAVPLGTPVRAVADGEVIFAGGDPCCSYGLYVIIQHDGGWASMYAHLKRVAFKAGARVFQGQVFGLIGVTGKTTGPHLHFELRLGGLPVDPLRYLPPNNDVRVIGDLDLDGTPEATQEAASDAPFNLPLLPLPAPTPGAPAGGAHATATPTEREPASNRTPPATDALATKEPTPTLVATAEPPATAATDEPPTVTPDARATPAAE